MVITEGIKEVERLGQVMTSFVFFCLLCHFGDILFKRFGRT